MKPPVLTLNQKVEIFPLNFNRLHEILAKLIELKPNNCYTNHEIKVTMTMTDIEEAPNITISRGDQEINSYINCVDVSYIAISNKNFWTMTKNQFDAEDVQET